MAKATITIAEMRSLVANLDNGAHELGVAKRSLDHHVATYNISHSVGGAVQQAIDWGEDQLPALRRRLALAEALEREPKPEWPKGSVVLEDDNAISKVDPDKAERDGAETAEKLLEGRGDLDPDLVKKLKENMNDPYFAAGFAGKTDPQQLASLLRTVDAFVEAKEVKVSLRDDLVEAMGSTIGTATRNTAELELPDTYAQKWADAITARSWNERGDVPDGQSQYLGLLMQHGSYGTEFLGTVGDQMYKYERSQGGDPVWGPKAPAMQSILDTDGKPVIDVMASYMTALGSNPDAAQKFFNGGPKVTVEVNGREMRVTERMKYMIQERTWSHVADATNGGRLGDALEAATTHYRDRGETGKLSASTASQMFALIGEQTKSGDGWRMWKGMRENVANIMGSYGGDLLRIGESGKADDFGTSYRAMNEKLWGKDAPYGAVMDPVLMREIMKTFGRDNEKGNLDTVLAGALAAGKMRQTAALENGLNDNTDPPAPVAMLEGKNVPGIFNANREEAAGLGWLVNAAYHGSLDDKEAQERRNKLMENVLDGLVITGAVGTTSRWARGGLEILKLRVIDGMKEPAPTRGGAYGELSADQKEKVRQSMMNQMLASGYFDKKYFDAANGDGTRYQAPPPGVINNKTDPPTFDFENTEAWEKWDFPINQFLDTSVYIPFNEGLNDGLSLAER